MSNDPAFCDQLIQLISLWEGNLQYPYDLEFFTRLFLGHNRKFKKNLSDANLHLGANILTSSSHVPLLYADYVYYEKKEVTCLGEKINKELKP